VVGDRICLAGRVSHQVLLTAVDVLATAGDLRADSALADVVASLPKAIDPGLRGLYVAGSYADRTGRSLEERSRRSVSLPT
jgi:hypothetical protein